MAGNTRPYVLGESPVPHKVRYIRGEAGELVYVYYHGVYPDGRMIQPQPDSKKVLPHFVVVPGIIMQHAGLQDRVLMCASVRLADRASAMAAIAADLKILPRDVGFAFW